MYYVELSKRQFLKCYDVGYYYSFSREINKMVLWDEK